MKPILLCLMLSVLGVQAQSNLDAILTQGLKQAVAGITPVPERDRQVVISQTAALLEKHVTFRPDGTSSSFYTMKGNRQSVEWQKLRIKSIVSMALTNADRLNGIEKRYLAILASDGTREWDRATNRWSAWRPIGHLLFPTGITVEWKQGQVLAKGSQFLPNFSPGPGPSITDRRSSPSMTPSTTDLPPGMTRGK